MSGVEFPWPSCPDCGLSASDMNDQVSQRLGLASRVQFKGHLASCYLCSDVYHREREFLVFSAEALYPTQYGPPVLSEERLTFPDFLVFFRTETQEFQSFEDCYRANPDPPDLGPISFLSNFPAAALSLVNEERILTSLPYIHEQLRTVIVLYLMGARTYTTLAYRTGCTLAEAKTSLFLGRRALQDQVCQREN